MKKIIIVLITISLFSFYSRAQNVDIIAGVWACSFNPGGHGGGSIVSFVDVDEFGRYYSVGACTPSNQGFGQTTFIGAGQSKTISVPITSSMGKSHFNNLYYFDWNGDLIKRGSTSLTIPWTNYSYSANYPISMYEDYLENIFIYKRDTIIKYDLNANMQWMKRTKAKFVTGDLNNNLYVAGDSIFKFDVNGNPLWNYPAVATKLVVDNKGNIYFRHAINNFLTKLDSTGSLIFSGPLVVPAEFAVDKNNNIYTLSADTVVMKYDSSGTNLVWTVVMAKSYQKISADAHQNCYIIGCVNYPSATPPNGNSYYARISSLEPPDTITCYVTDTVYCAGDSVEVYFNTSPTPNSGAMYNVYLSDSAGNFIPATYPLSSGNSSPIKFKLPPNLPLGSSLYRLMVKVYPADSTGINIPSNNFTITTQPLVTITPSQAIACKGDSAIYLALSPTGGMLTGNGVFGNYFYPDSISAPYSDVTYVYTDSNSCTGSLTKRLSVGVHITPTLTLSNDTICLIPGVFDTAYYNATLYINGNSPFINNSFYFGSPWLVPGINEIKVLHNDNGCRDSIIDYVYAHAVNPISFTVSEDTVCRYSNPVLLSGIPSGGTFSGTYVAGNYFYPDSTIIYQYQWVDYTYTDSNGCAQTTSKIIYVDDCLGLQQISSNDIIIYPNPSTNNLMIMDDHYLKPYTIYINDPYGRNVMRLNVKGRQQDFNITKLAKGVYFLQHENESSKRSFKLIKQ